MKINYPKIINKTTTLFITLIILLLNNCTKNKIVNSEENIDSKTVPVQIDFINGFENHHVMIFVSILTQMAAFFGGCPN